MIIHDADERPPINEAEDAVIIAMCKAHDREDAAQKGEPTPWSPESEADTEWVSERFFAMREAFDIAAAYFTGSPPDQGLRPVGDYLPTVLADIAKISRHLTAREIDRRVTAAVRAAVAPSPYEPRPSFDKDCLA